MAEAPSIQDQLAESIATAGTKDYKPVESNAEPTTETAPAKDNPTPVTE